MENVREVTVYLNGAQVTRQGTFELKNGANTIRFSGLPQNINEQSITVSSENAAVLSVSYRSLYSESDNAKRIEDLLKELEKLQKDLEHENNVSNMLYFEEEILKNNSKTDNGKMFRSSDIKDSVIFFRERMTDIFEKRMICEKRMEELNEKISSIQSELGTDRASRQRSEVTVEMFSDGDVKETVQLTYFTYNAGWSPYYDIRAKDVDSPIRILSKAMVYQHTGEDWVDVSLTLSTGTPTLSGDVPELRPWYLDLEMPMMRQQFNAPTERLVASKVMMAEIADEEHVPESAVGQVENLTSVEYALKAPYTIETSGNGRSVDIDSNELPAEFVYRSVRKLEKDVFLVAEMKDWEGMNLAAGNANIFFEDKYVGQTYLDPAKGDGPLMISLGRDRNVVVTRERGKDFASKSALGNNKASREWELTAKNLKKQPITIIVEDQIPVSVNKSITVDAVNISGASLDKETGKLEWRFTLKPAESKKMDVKYEVSYPKTGNVRLE